MHSWGLEATNSAIEAKTQPDGVVPVAQKLAEYFRSNGSSEVVPGIKYIQSDNLDNFQAGTTAQISHCH